MADYEHKEYASKGVAGAGLGLGIAGTALGLGLFGGRGFFGGHGGYGDGHGGHGGHGRCDCDRRGPHVDRFELMEAQKIAGLESQNAFLRAEIDIQRKFGIVETQIAHLQDADKCIREEICELRGRLNRITAEVVPASVVVPITPEA